jgi:hypothetical protein
MKKVVKTVVGVLCIILGLVALFTPLTPGSWLIPIGLELLGLRLLLERRLRAWADAHPNSKIARAVCWLLRLRPRGGTARRRRWCRAPQAGEPACHAGVKQPEQPEKTASERARETIPTDVDSQ